MRSPAAATTLLALALAACDDPQQLDRTPSDLYVNVYVERDDTTGMSAGDTPLRASVSLLAQDGATEPEDSTGADGTVSFLELPVGAYTVSHTPTDLPAGLERVGSWRQTVVVPPAVDTVLVRFVYRDTVSVPAAARD